MEKEIFALEGGGFGYRILVNGAVVTDQPFAPGVDGLVLMTEAEAHAFADQEIARNQTDL